MSKKEAEKPIEITWLDIKKVLPAAYNPRDISLEAMAGLKNSLKEFGIVDPFIMNRRSGLLVGGHQRLKAASELGFKKVPVVYVDLDSGREKLLNVTLNNPKISGHYNDSLNELLADIATELPDFNFDDLRMNGMESLIVGDVSWNSDIKKMDSIRESSEQAKGKIKITCPPDIYDEVLIFIKAKFLETSFEGVHVE